MIRFEKAKLQDAKGLALASVIRNHPVVEQ